MLSPQRTSEKSNSYQKYALKHNMVRILEPVSSFQSVALCVLFKIGDFLGGTAFWDESFSLGWVIFLRSLRIFLGSINSYPGGPIIKLHINNMYS